MAASLDYQAIGERIRRLRKQANLTQAALAEMVDIGSRHMSKIETGSCLLSLPCLVNLASALHTTADTLLMDAPIDKPPLLIDAERALADCSSAELLAILRTITALKKSRGIAGGITYAGIAPC